MSASDIAFCSDLSWVGNAIRPLRAAGLLRLPRAKAGPDGWQPSRTREAMRVLGPAMPGLHGWR